MFHVKKGPARLKNSVPNSPTSTSKTLMKKSLMKSSRPCLKLLVPSLPVFSKGTVTANLKGKQN